MEQVKLKQKNEEKTESMTEESFLKDLHFFMKQKETPIERIPHLGFKQINLYLMFKAVMELGGYHQVTAQQLWKKVYNILGGNPRSTSAATCTRRHYEKLLLPYEYHLAGYGDEVPITLPRQRKRFHPDDEYNQGPKRADFTSLHQYNQYLQPSPISLPSYLAVSLPSVPSLSSPLHSRPVMSYIPPSPMETGTVKQSLEFLRHLAQEYKSSSGWTEPLNLSKKQGRLETSSNIPSSFTSPSVKKKEPKFLNEAPPLQQGNQSVVGEAPPPAQALINQTIREESHVVNLTSSCSSSPNMWNVAPSSTPPPSPLSPPSHRPNYPSTVQTKQAPQQSLQVPVSKSGSSTTSQLNPGTINPTFPLEPYAGMEIQIPLSLLQNLIKGGLLLNTASNQYHLPSSKPNETPSLPERMTSETNADQPADLSLKNQVRNMKKGDINMNASKSAYEKQTPESKPFAVKPLQIAQPAKFPFYSHVSPFKSPQRVFQEQETCSKQVPPATVRIPHQPGLKFPGYSKDVAQTGAINSGMMSEKTMLNPPLDKTKPSSASFVQITPEHLKLLFSNSPFRLESGKIC
ncbi:AT-rich interaction domain 6 [Ictalurus punctatus]|uniref:AT-rich interaction domain 6 n=1 Tax=Ictalurus punctatus TaxID=7998 RepID=A0A2D0T201_ICTPU|nr:AT-rich interaction domain 6 [Ictalurus punctatus]